MKFKRLLGSLVSISAAMIMTVGVQAATYSTGVVKTSAGSEVSVPVVVTPGTDETVSINAYAMVFTYNPTLATPVVAGKDITNADCYGTVGTSFGTDNSVFVSDIISVSDTEAKIAIAWAGADPISLSQAADLADVTFDVADTATGEVPLTITTASVASSDTAVAEISDISSGKIDLNTKSFLRGDADGNGVVEAKDAALISQSLVNLGTIETENMERADANADGNVDAKDAALISQYLVNLGVIPE